MISLITVASLADFLVLETFFWGCYIANSVNFGHQSCGSFFSPDLMRTCKEAMWYDCLFIASMYFHRSISTVPVCLTFVAVVKLSWVLPSLGGFVIFAIFS